MTVVSMNYLLEAGVHFGHQKRRWNPKMKEYIYTSRDDIYIIDLQKTVKQIEEAYDALKKIAEDYDFIIKAEDYGRYNQWEKADIKLYIDNDFDRGYILEGIDHDMALVKFGNQYG